MKKNIIISIIFLIVLGIFVSRTEWLANQRLRWYWREFASDCGEEGGRFELCLKSPICRFEDGNFWIPFNGYGHKITIGGLRGEKMWLNDDAEEKMEWSMTLIDIDESCIK